MAKANEDEGRPEASDKPPTRKADGSLNRAGMEEVIKAGGSIIHQGTLYGTLAELPDEATLVAGDEQAKASALAGIDAEERNLAERRARIEAAGKPATDATKPPPSPDTTFAERQAKAEEERAKAELESRERAAKDAPAPVEDESAGRAKTREEQAARAKAEADEAANKVHPHAPTPPKK